jgi:hypothetical protein
VALPASSADQHTLISILPHVSFILAGVGSQPTIRFTGVNVQIVDGSGHTNVVNGSGNLVLGYDETAGTQTGSHDLILGQTQTYTSYGQIVTGSNNQATAPYASVFGFRNVAGGSYSLAAGDDNTVSGSTSTVLGGYKNTVSSAYSSLLGGCSNLVGTGTLSISSLCFDTQGHDHDFDSVSGGAANTANGVSSSVSGGVSNTAGGTSDSVSGGTTNVANGGFAASVSGGAGNTASGEGSSVSGGTSNTASSSSSSVSGGWSNLAGETYSAILGGCGNSTGASAASDPGCFSQGAGAFDSVAGGYDNLASGGLGSFIAGGNEDRALGVNSVALGGFRAIVESGGGSSMSQFGGTETLSSSTNNESEVGGTLFSP